MAVSSRLRRPALFRGWAVVAVAALATFAEVTFFNPVLGVFVAPLEEEFGWGRATIAAALTFGGFAAAAVSPLVGRALDAWGGRPLLAAGAVLVGLCAFGLMAVDRLWSFYLLYSVGRAASVGVVSLAAAVTVSNWFIRRRGLALGILQVGTRAGQAVLPLVAQLTIAAASWRAAWGVLGALTLAVTVVPTLLVVRRRPEDVGLLPDGDARPVPVAGGSDGPAAPEVEETWTFREAVRTRAYWLLLLALSAEVMVGGSINFHLFPHLTDRGLPPGIAITVLSTYATIGAVGGIAGGWVQQRAGARWTMAASLVLSAAGLLILINVSTRATAFLFSLVYGLAFGSVVTMSHAVVAEYFGRLSLGTIRGSMQPAILTVNALGPLTAGLAYDLTGEYTRVFLLFAAMALLSSTLLALAPRPHRAAA
ncbi:MAG TPA: MFS transporter [Dehalococcoidia bacterium]